MWRGPRPHKVERTRRHAEYIITGHIIFCHKRAFHRWITKYTNVKVWFHHNSILQLSIYNKKNFQIQINVRPNSDHVEVLKKYLKDYQKYQ